MTRPRAQRDRPGPSPDSTNERHRARPGALLEASPRSAPLAVLQSQVGNRAVGRMLSGRYPTPPRAAHLFPSAPARLQRKCASCEAEDQDRLALQRKCSSCQAEDEERLGLQRKCASCQADEGEALGLQRQLAIGPVDDPCEREADRVADAVVRGRALEAGRAPREATAVPSGPVVVRAPLTEANGRLTIRGRFLTEPEATPASDLERRIRQSRGAGHVLPSPARTALESRLGYDFSGVRVHRDASAQRLAHEVNALAFTVDRDVFFGRDAYRPGTRSGDHLIAHELTHVVQQSAPTTLRASPIARRATRPLLQRRISEPIIEHPLEPQAGACLVHLHGDEENAFAAAGEMHRLFCTNYVHLGSTTREVHLDVTASASGLSRPAACLADPNRVFTSTGILNNALASCTVARLGGLSTAVKVGLRASAAAEARTQLTTWATTQLRPAIDRCRHANAPGGAAALPTVAFHNNRPGPSVSVKPTDLIDTPTGMPSVRDQHIVATEDADNFILVTQGPDFAAMPARRNVIWQAPVVPTGTAGTNPATPMVTDDGSLSVALANERYLNLEVEGKPFTHSGSPGFVTNRTMAFEILRFLGIPRRPCNDPTSRSISWTPPATSAQAAPGPQSPAPASAPTPLPRESAPTNLPRGCRTFADQAALDQRKADLTARHLTPAATRTVVSWIVGRVTPPSTVRTESRSQLDCMLGVLRARAAGLGATLPAGGVISPHRSFGSQQSIWNRKFEFLTRFSCSGPDALRNRFDRISSFARTTCGSLLSPTDVQWDPCNTSHRVCWGASALSGTTAPALPTGARALTGTEREREILQASSAPGISRHHFGSDFDIFSTEPADWTGAGPFAGIFPWLIRNASTYGFLQSFTATSGGFGAGYMEERWHWSYYPWAQALLDFANTHRPDIEVALNRAWGTGSQFSFVRTAWERFMFNVAQQAVF